MKIIERLSNHLISHHTLNGTCHHFLLQFCHPSNTHFNQSLWHTIDIDSIRFETSSARPARPARPARSQALATKRGPYIRPLTTEFLFEWKFYLRLRNGKAVSLTAKHATHSPAEICSATNWHNRQAAARWTCRGIRVSGLPICMIRSNHVKRRRYLISMQFNQFLSGKTVEGESRPTQRTKLERG